MDGEGFDSLYQEYLEAVKTNTVEEKGWKKWGYGTSKLFLNIFTQRLAKLDDIVNRNIQVNNIPLSLFCLIINLF